MRYGLLALTCALRASAFDAIKHHTVTRPCKAVAIKARSG
jgi:hypothetical protein